VYAGYGLTELKPIGLSLEEVFLQLTRDEPIPPAVDDQGDADGETEG
jgi:hypothetical protein